MLYDLNDRSSGADPPRKDSGKIGETGTGPRVNESHVKDGNRMAENPSKSPDRFILSKVIPVIRSHSSGATIMFFSSSLAGKQRIVIGNGGQVSSKFLKVVLASHWSARCRCRGDAKVIDRHLLQTCTKGFHIPMGKTSLCPRQRSNMSRRTSSGRISIVTCPAIHHTSQHQWGTKQRSRPTFAALISCVIGRIFLVVWGCLSHREAFGRVDLSPRPVFTWR